ncbi:MAG TPA: prolyl oligopeptidase family serine peptidase [Hanamia sp.]|nr:prolyl oligopeptidase family serine peptidase [Hanamia sp.]
MKAVLFLLICPLFYISCTNSLANNNAKGTTPPITQRTPVVDNYFGMKVTDNYRWLENMKDSSVVNWFKAQSDYTNSFLDKIPGRDSLVEAFKKLDALTPVRITDIVRKDNRYFYKKTLPDEKVGKLYFRDGENGAETLLYDPGMDKDGKPQSLNSFSASEDGKNVALAVTQGGAEVSRIYTINVDSKKIDPESIYPATSLFGWSPDNKGFLYLMLNSADNKSMDLESDTRAMYHEMGSASSNDKEIFSKRKYPNLGLTSADFCVAYYSDDFKYIIAGPSTVSNDLTCFYAPASDLLNPVIPWKPLLQKKDHVTGLAFDGDDVYMLTYENAPQYKIIKSNLGNFSVADAKVVVPEGKDKITNMARSKGYLFISYSDGINGGAKQYNLHNGDLASINLPIEGCGEGGKVLTPYGIHSNDGYIEITSWKQPLAVYDYNADNQKTALSAFNVKANYPGMEDVQVVETEAPGQDGTMIPLSIVYNKNLKLDGTSSCLLTGYGAYGISLTPSFSILPLALVNKGIVFAVAHPRGGGEKGEAWYKAGYKTTKPNTWKDFISCAEYLIKNKYTSSAKLIGLGTSAGGITIGRAITSRPDLFGAAIDNVGCSNALRLENSPNGPVNIPEFGTVKDSVESRALYEMDDLHHVKEGVKYPAVICVCGWHDPRVIAWQPAKFAAALQHATASGKPVLLDVNYDDGHFTEDKSVTFKNFANMFAFGLWQTGNPDFQIKD